MDQKTRGQGADLHFGVKISSGLAGALGVLLATTTGTPTGASLGATLSTGPMPNTPSTHEHSIVFASDDTMSEA